MKHHASFGLGHIVTLAVSAMLSAAVKAGPSPLPPLYVNTLPKLQIDANSIGLPTPPSTLPTRGPWLPVDELPKPQIVHFDPYGVINGPRPPKHEVDQFAVDSLLGDLSITTLNVTLIVPAAAVSSFDGLEAMLESHRPGLNATLSFLTPESLNSCVASVGVPGPGGSGGGFIDTCDPQSPPARTPGMAELYYVGGFDWSVWPGTGNSNAYIYSLINLGAALYLDADDFDPANVDSSVGDAIERVFSIGSYDLKPGPNRSFSADYVAVTEVAARSGAGQVDEPGTWLLALVPALGLAARNLRRRGKRGSRRE